MVSENENESMMQTATTIAFIVYTVNKSDGHNDGIQLIFAAFYYPASMPKKKDENVENEE